MSQTLLFEIGAVIFLAVVTALFLYGLAEFKDWQDRDDSRADAIRDTEHAGTVTAMPVPDHTAGRVVPLDRSAVDASDRGSRPSIVRDAHRGNASLHAGWASHVEVVVTSDLDLPAGLDGASVGIVIVTARARPRWCAQDLTPRWCRVSDGRSATRTVGGKQPRLCDRALRRRSR